QPRALVVDSLSSHLPSLLSKRVRPQAQTTRNDQEVSVETSVQTVKLLIETGVGCITFLRGLLPDENFEDTRISAPRLAGVDLNAFPASSQGDKKLQTVKVKKIIRGFSDEADRIMDWIRPEMVVRDQLRGMVISGENQTHPGSRRTVSEDDTKRQVQKLIKKPFKVDSPQLQLTTSQIEETPEVLSLGSLATGHHGVTLHVTHIAPLLEVSPDQSLSPSEALARNRLDAMSRPVAWDVQNLVSQNVLGAPIDAMNPVGVLDDEGNLQSVKDVEMGLCGVELKEKVGLGEFVSRTVLGKEDDAERRRASGEDDNAALAAKNSSQSEESSQANTQAEPVISRAKSIRPPVPLFDETPEEYKIRRRSVEASREKPTPSPESSQEEAVAGPSHHQLESVQEDDEDDNMKEAGLSYLVDHLRSCKRRRRDAASLSGSVFRPSENSQQAQLILHSHLSDTQTSQDEDSNAHQPAQPQPSSSKKVANTRASSRKSVSSSGSTMGTWAKSAGRLSMTCDCGDKEDDEAMVGCSGVPLSHYRSSPDSNLPQKKLALDGDMIERKSEEHETSTAASARALKPSAQLTKAGASPASTLSAAGNAGMDDDPIVTSDDEDEPASAVKALNRTAKGKGKEQVVEKAKAPVYVPSFGPKGKAGPLAGALSKSDFHRASSIFLTPTADSFDPPNRSMDVDPDPINEEEEEESQPEPDTQVETQWNTPGFSGSVRPTAGSKRPSPREEEEDEAEEHARIDETRNGTRTKKLRGSEVEGPVEVL
ncbi:hypothetical protein P7C70_g943, partial [Phenoliferia sp. Uapishka_3]